jgi:hypothetical protein
MQTVAHLFAHAEKKGQANLKQCLEQALASKPRCSGYMEAIGHYITNYGGGSDFCCIAVLQHISSFPAIGISACQCHMTCLPFNFVVPCL